MFESNELYDQSNSVEPNELHDSVRSYTYEKNYWKLKAIQKEIEQPDDETPQSRDQYPFSNKHYEDGDEIQTDISFETTEINKTQRSSIPIGLLGIIEQKCKQTKEEGITFNIMVAGQVGVGKTTLINSLFDTILINENNNDINSRINGEQLQINKFVLENNDMKLNFTCIETSNYRNHRDNSFAWTPITTYIDQQIK